MSRHLGGLFSQPCTLQRAYADTLIYQSKSNPILESQSFLECELSDVHDTWPVSNAVLDGIVADVKEEKIIIDLCITTDLHAITRTLRNTIHDLLRDRGCHIH